MIRKTKQRDAIIKAFQTAGRPLTIQEVLEIGRSFAPSLGQRTVYRYVNDLAKESKIVGIDYPGQLLRYELVRDKKHHPHLICRTCNNVFELQMDIDLPKYTPPDGFTIQGEEVIFYGQCPNCNS